MREVMENKQLAIASVPCQTWGTTYQPEEALRIGTIFEDLNKPFFAADVDRNSNDTQDNMLSKPPEQIKREQLLSQISQISFFLDDLALYLDTHETDTNAIGLFTKYSKKRKELKTEYAAAHYPLTRDCIADLDAKEPFCWLEGPMPWEGACI